MHLNPSSYALQGLQTSYIAFAFAYSPSSQSVTMLPIAVSLAVLASLGLASPVEQKPSAAVITLPRRSTMITPQEVFDRKAAAAERARVHHRAKQWKNRAKTNASPIVEKRALATGEPFDISKLRRRASGVIAMTDYDIQNQDSE